MIWGYPNCRKPPHWWNISSCRELRAEFSSPVTGCKKLWVDCHSCNAPGIHVSIYCNYTILYIRISYIYIYYLILLYLDTYYVKWVIITRAIAGKQVHAPWVFIWDFEWFLIWKGICLGFCAWFSCPMICSYFFSGILIFKQIEPQKNMASHLPHLSFTATSLRDAPPLSVDLMLKVLPLSVTMAAVGLLECLGRRGRRMKIYEGEIRKMWNFINKKIANILLSKSGIFKVYLRCL